MTENKNQVFYRFSKQDIGSIRAIIIGIIILLVGILMFYTKMAGSRSGDVIEGPLAQIGGIIFIFFGIYLLISSIRKLIKSAK